MAQDLRLVIMTFPQRWDPTTNTLAVNAVLIPTVSPLDNPLLGGSSPKFADHVPDLRAVVIGNLAGGPLTSDPGRRGFCRLSCSRCRSCRHARATRSSWRRHRRGM